MNGRPVDLEDFRGGLTLLAFHRFAACPFCNFRIHELHMHRDALAGIRVVIVFESSPENIAKADSAHTYPFSFIGDPKKTLYELYGVEHSLGGLVSAFLQPQHMKRPPSVPKEGSLTRMPADFLIGPDLRLIAAHYGENAADHMSVETLKAHAQAQARVDQRRDEVAGGNL